jgi:hypothetical protein
VLEGQRGELTQGEITDRAIGSIMKAPLRAAAGPLAQFGYTAATGKDLSGRQVAAKANPDESQYGKNLTAALLGVNSAVKAAEPWVAKQFGFSPSPQKDQPLDQRLLGILGPAAPRQAPSPSAKALGDVYELKRQFLAREGRPSEPSQPSQIGRMRDAAIAGDQDAFSEAKQDYLSKAAVGRRPEQVIAGLRESIQRMDPLVGMNKHDRALFVQGLNEKQRAKLDLARQHVKEVQSNFVRMWKGQ